MSYYYEEEVAVNADAQYVADMAQEQIDMGLQQIMEGLTQIENIDFQAQDASVVTSFDGAEMSAWFGEQVTAFEENQLSIEDLFADWMNVMVSTSQEYAPSIEQLAMERYTMKEEATMEAAEYIGQHIQINGQTLCEVVEDIAAQMAAAAAAREEWDMDCVYMEDGTELCFE